MYLKSININGFKSFADKVNIELNGGITAIVGPNGSGKSNIVDAIRWVLGEQSVKSLRGSDVMSDVIFSGSSSRDAQKKASVSLIFDNQDHYLNSEFDEIEIKRMVYSSGENEYYLNNTRVRLKDITNLFIDSGAGSGAFNIISQGNITDIVNSKPQDRRIIFESAAGVLKYKKRKEEAIRKLDRTKDNLKSIKLVLDELSTTVLPLKEQSEVAQKYLDLKEQLESVEIALIAKDITTYSKQFEELKSNIVLLENELSQSEQAEESVEMDKLKLEVLKIDDKISDINNKLIKLNDELAKLISEKQLTIERQKFNVDKKKIDDVLLKSKEVILELEKDINVVESALKQLNDEAKEKDNKLGNIRDELIQLKIKRSNVNAKVDEKNKKIFYLQNKIDIIKANILNNDRLPSSVKNIINNQRLKGVHNTIGNLIDIPLEYELAISTTLGASANFVVVDNFDSAKKCIDYLKNEHLGRATFFPLDTIKARNIDKTTIDLLKKEAGFVGIASSLVSFDEKYKCIIENQLGNVIVVNSLQNLNDISKKYDYKFRCVSLDGEIMHVGGSVTGGNKGNDNVSSKQILKNLEHELNSIELDLKTALQEQRIITDEYNSKEDIEQNLAKELIILNEEITTKESNVASMKSDLELKKSEAAGSENLLNNKLDKYLVELLENINKKSEDKTILEHELMSLKAKRLEYNDQINEMEKIYRDNNSKYNKLQNDLKNDEIEKGKLEVKLDNLLVTLNDTYNLTYEAAADKYTLDIEEKVARDKVKSTKKAIDALGSVNIGSIAEYERLSKRYTFLQTQEADLVNASEELLGIISEMDEIMVNKFKTSFDKIASEFKNVFKTIFQGGKGELKLTDSDDILNSGIEIIAEPPGKKINSTVALSGGEQALTAICLLFSILNVRPVPFIVLDEAEAALDEANVDMFGKYINNKKKDSQFVLITHKKRMMEYADTLYGITMQESGISKIVSAKLAE